MLNQRLISIEICFFRVCFIAQKKTMAMTRTFFHTDNNEDHLLKLDNQFQKLTKIKGIKKFI